MKDPTNPNREMMSFEEACRERARLEVQMDQALASPANDELWTRAHIDYLFAPFEVSCPTLAEYLRRHA